MSDIVERLDSGDDTCLREAADEIERLRADVDFHLNTIGRMTAEIERLRAALQNIIQGNGGECGCTETARHALEEKK